MVSGQGVSGRGVFARGRVWSGGCLVRVGGIPACTEADPPPCEQNERQV